MKRQVLKVTIAVMILLSIDARSDVPDAGRHEVQEMI